MEAKIVNQLVIPVKDEVGLLGRLLGLISDKGINVQAYCVYTNSGSGTLLMITNNDIAAEKALAEQGFEPAEEEVLVLTVDNKVGICADISKKLGHAGINIKYSYATPESLSKAVVILCTSDNDRALKLLM